MDRLQLLRNFQKKKAAGEVDPYGDLVEGVHPDWREVGGARPGASVPQQRYLWSGPIVVWNGAQCQQFLAGLAGHIPSLPPSLPGRPRQVDRVIAHRSRLGRRTFLVKWRGLGYSESTWEPERDLEGEEVGGYSAAPPAGYSAGRWVAG